MYVHPNCEFKTGDLVELFWHGDDFTPLIKRSYGLHVFLDNERPSHLKDDVPLEYENGPRFYKLYALKSDGEKEDIETYDRPYWIFKKA